MPIPISIKELDGLPEGEIRLAILESEQKTWGIMESKLKEHREAIELKFDEQDAKLESMQEDLTALVGSEKVPGLITRNTELLQNLVDKHEAWHEEDTTFRQSITTKVSELSQQHTEIAKEIKSIKWFIRSCTAIRRIAKSTFAATRESTTAKRVGFGTIIWIAVIQFCHILYPIIATWLRQ